MPKKKIKIEVAGLVITGSDITKFYDLAGTYTLASIHERERGHLEVHNRLINTALDIRNQITEQM